MPGSFLRQTAYKMQVSGGVASILSCLRSMAVVSKI